MLTKTVASIEEILSPNSKSRPKKDLFESSLDTKKTEHTFYWDKQGDGLLLPLAIVPSTNDYESLFAEIATFHPHLTPISAYVHVCSKETSSILALENKRTQKRGKSSDSYINKLISIILGEAVTDALDGGQNLVTANIGYAVCSQTLGACLARAKHIYEQISSNEIAKNWTLARHITNTETSTNYNLSQDFFSLLFNDSQRGALELEAIYDFVDEKIGTDQIKSYFIKTFDLHALDRSISENYNSRITAFNSIAEKINSTQCPTILKSAAIAYYCNRILPGSMNHAATLKSHIKEHPQIVFWYMYFSCTSKEFDIRNAMSGICLKLSRDILKPFSILERPDCDISVDELKIISRLSMKASTLKPKKNRSLSISLLPGVNIELDLNSSEPPKVQAYEKELDSSRVRSLLFEAIDLLGKDTKSRNKYSSEFRKRYSE